MGFNLRPGNCKLLPLPSSSPAFVCQFAYLKNSFI